MRISIAGLATQVFILFISLVVLPVYFMSIIQYYKDINRIQIAERNFVDSVIDNRQVSDATLSELNISIAAVSTPVTVSIKREVRIVDPSAVAGKVETQWVYVEWHQNDDWNQGDIITVSVEQNNANIMQQLSSVFLGSGYNNLKMDLSAMVR